MNPGKIYSIVSLSAVILISVMVLIGWRFEIKILNSISPLFVAMNPVTAVTFIIAATCLICIRQEEKFNLKILLNIFAISVALVGILRIIDYLTTYDFMVDAWLFSRQINLEPSSVSGRMAPHTAVNFIFLGVSLYYLNIKRRRAFASDYIAAWMAMIAFLSIIGYLYKAEELYVIKNFIPMALPTAISFCILAMGILSYEKDAGFIKEITSPSGGRQISVILLPATLIIPTVLGLLALQAQETAFFSTNFSMAVLAILISIILLFFVFKVARSINRSNYSLVKEIENRTEIEKALSKNTIFLNQALNSIPDALFIKEVKSLRYVKVNDAFAKLFNTSETELFGKTDYDLFSKETADTFIKEDRSILHSGEMVQHSERRVIIGNKAYWFNTKKYRLTDANGEPCILGLVRDITEQKKQQQRIKEFNSELERKVIERTKDLQKSEQRYRALIENGIDAIKMMDANGVIFYASESHYRFIGYTPQELILTNLLDHVHPDDYNLANEVLNGILKERSVSKRATLRFQHKSGHSVWAEGSVTNLLHDENVKALVCNFHDVTEREEMQNERLNLQAALTNERINKEKQIAQATLDGEERERTAIGMELHDNINQILGAVKLYIGMAKNRPDLSAEMLDKAEENLAISIQEVRRLSKALVSPDVGLGLTKSISDLVSVLNESTGINIKLNIESEAIQPIGERVELTLYRITQEQLNNVIKHSAAKNVSISVSTLNNCLELKITDDGKGFDPSLKYKGIGFKNIANRVEFLKGEYQIISAPNKGCTLSVRVPISEVAV